MNHTRHTSKNPAKRQRVGVRTLHVNIDTGLRTKLDQCTEAEDRTLRSIVERALRRELKGK